MREELGVDRLWDEEIFLADGDRIFRVQSTRDAYLILRNHWHHDDGPARQAALAICHMGEHSSRSPDDARRAFIEAAREASIAVNSWSGS
ncbi:DUF982 domain-containing protein [Ensifer sp. NM-2]|jgi:hypothetical protein|uniref:DUF982 domain-containing protein n=1 Tax=unclassified Ensifer TaxID=2633371 RepID=UPI00070C3FF7|nr:MULTISPECIES: DUF982 domain-containing protein [unclassified Ensifer]PSS64361.1 DUF982 domain-containing protein [Ensifer sp. NM-2]